MGFKKGLDITRESWQVLRKDRELLLFPVFSLVTATVIVVVIFSASILMPGLKSLASSLFSDKQVHTVAEQALGILGLFLIYFVNWFVVIYFNTADRKSTRLNSSH